MAQEHAPTPWRHYCHTSTIYGGDGFYIAIAQGKNSKADADLIVTAVNSYASSQAEIARLKAALEFYANPEIYKPHPHGPAFDRRDLSSTAIAALSEGK